MKPHALVIALSALSAGTATAQTVGDRYGYERPAYAPPSAYGAPYASQQAQPAVGRTLTWTNKSAYSAPAPAYDNRYAQPAPETYARPQYAPPRRDYGPAPYARAPQDEAPPEQARQYSAPQYQPQAYAPQYAQPMARAQTYAPASGYVPYTPQEPYAQSAPHQAQPGYAQPGYPQPQYAEPSQARYEPTAYVPTSRGETTYVPAERPAMIEAAPAGSNGARIEMSSELSGGPPDVGPASSQPYPAMAPARPVASAPARMPMAPAAPSPMRVADAQPGERSQVHYYSLHRAYGLTPDSIPAPDPSKGMVLIGPGDSATAPKGSSDKDDDTASEKPF